MTDLRKLLDTIQDLSENTSLELHDNFDIELGEDLLIETGIVDITEDGIVVEGDEETLKLLAEHGLILEETDWSKYDEPTVSRIAKGKTKPVDRTDYDTPPAMRDPMQGKPGYQKRRASLVKQGILKAVSEKMVMGLPGDQGSKVMGEEGVAEGEVVKGPWAGSSTSVEKVPTGFTVQHPKLIYLYYNPKTQEVYNAVSGEQHKDYGNDFYWHRSGGQYEWPEGPKTKVSADDMRDFLSKHDNLDETTVDKIEINGKPVNLKSLEVDGVDTRDYPDFSDAYLTYAEFEDGTPLSDKEIELFQNKHDDLVYQVAYDSLFEAKYQGREVPLGKPMAGDVKKSKVYVRKPNGKVVKVNFGDKKMRIKKSNPKRRKSFRARHNCKNPGPRWKARYWSCRAW